jgi:hypothetical protein
MERSCNERLLVFAAIIEAATGVALILVPSLVGQLLPGNELTGVIVRVAGIALIALAIACWPGPAMFGMLIHNAAVALYLAYVGISGKSSGVLLWPVVVLHGIMTVLLIRAMTSQERNSQAPTNPTVTGGSLSVAVLLMIRSQGNSSITAIGCGFNRSTQQIG